MSGYKLRITTDQNQKVLDMAKKYFERYVVSFEDQRKHPHCHFYLEFKSSVKVLSFRQYLSRTFNTESKGNGRYALAELDSTEPIEYLGYITKQGDYQTHEMCPFLMAEAIAHEVDLKASMKEKKKARRTQLQTISEDCFGEAYLRTDGPVPGWKVKLDPDNPNREQDLDQTYITKVVVDYYYEQGTLIREFALLSIIQTLTLKYDTNGREHLTQRLLEKLNK